MTIHAERRKVHSLRVLVPLSALALVACGQPGNADATHDNVQPSGSDDAGALEAASDGHFFAVDWFDDWEDGNRDILPVGGRFGHWNNYDDQTPGTNTIAVVGLDPATDVHTTYQTTSKMALRVQVSGYDNWGSGFSADIAASKPYDVSAYAGIVLWVKNLSQTPGAIRVTISDASSDPRGGICDKSADASTSVACYDSFGQNLDLLSGWQMYRLPFWALQQGGWGLPEPTGLDSRHVYDIAFGSGAAGVTYDYYVDDIGFYRE